MYEYISNEFDFWSVHGIMNTSGLLQSLTSVCCELRKLFFDTDALRVKHNLFYF